MRDPCAGIPSLMDDPRRGSKHNYNWMPEGSLAGFVGCIFEICPAPEAREGLRKCGEAKPPTFLKAFPGPRGRPDLKNAPNKIRPDCLQVPSPLEWPWNRSPGLILVDLCSICQAGVVGNGPGPKFGRKPAQNQPKLKSRFQYPDCLQVPSR